MIKLENKGQSIVEYAILLGVVITALLIMQVFVKRSYQGNLKDSAGKFGEQFSSRNTEIRQKRTMANDQIIQEQVATDANFGMVTGKDLGLAAHSGTVGKGAYSYTDRSGGQVTAETSSSTDATAKETGAHPKVPVTDFPPAATVNLDGNIK